MKYYKTSFSNFVDYLYSTFSRIIVGSWKKRSLGLISLLIGFYVSSTFNSYMLQVISQRIIVVILLILFIEFLVRVRNYMFNGKLDLYLNVIDNFRIGIIYAIVLEAFKLGS